MLIPDRLTRRACLSTAATAAALLAVPAFATETKPLHVVMLSGSAEYHSDETLPAFAEELEEQYLLRCTRVFGQDRAEAPMPGIEAIETADLVVVFTRRLRPPKPQLDLFKKYCAAGKAIVGIRTASHAFQDWLEFDKLILGGNYQNHYDAGETSVKIVEESKAHPVLEGVEPFKSAAKLYKNPGVGSDGKVGLLLTGTIPDHTEPLAWIREHDGSRAFYTSLGAPSDFANPTFRRLLTNAVCWAVGRTPRELRRT